MFRKLLPYLYKQIDKVKRMIATKTHPGKEIVNRLYSELEHIEQIKNNKATNTEAKIHEIRKSIKRMRSLIRLLKSSLPKKTYYKLDGFLSKAGGSMTEMRESTVNLKTFLGLFQEHTSFLPSELSRRIISILSDQIRNAYDNTNKGYENTLAGVNFNLQQIKTYLETDRIPHISPKDLLNVVDNAYIKASSTYNDALYTLETEVIHTWRKHAKYLLLQLKFSPALPGTELDPLRKILDKLTDALGKEHDLAILEDKLNTECNLNKEEQQRIHLIISKSRSRMQKLAFQLGESVFSKEAINSYRAYFVS